MRLRDRHVLITGASRGIGAGLAAAAAARGARVSLVARDTEQLTAVAGQIGGAVFAADLAAPDEVNGLVERVEAESGGIDVLINNAGISHVGHLLDRTAEEITRLFAVNLVAPALLCQQVLPGMLQRGRGQLVSISSLAGVMTSPGLVHDGASKAGLSHFTAGLRQDLRGQPVTVTLVELGSVPTEMDDASRSYEPIRRVAERSKGRDITPLADAVRAIVEGIESDRRHVRLPRQLAVLPALVEMPRRLSERVFARGGHGPR